MTIGVTLKRRIVVALIFTFISLVGFAVYTLRVEEVKVTGLRTLDPKMVIDASGLRGGERILWIRLSSVARRIERIPAVASVTTERSLPRTVVIRVRERTALARLEAPAPLVVDGDGWIFSSTDTTPLPLIQGWGGEPRQGTSVDAATKLVLDEFSRFPEEMRRGTARIVVGPPLTLVLADAIEVRFGHHVGLNRKAKVAEAVLAAAGRADLEYVDVRTPEVPVSRKRPPPTPTPTAQPARTAPPAATASPAPQ